MKYLVVLKKEAFAPVGFDTAEQAVADFHFLSSLPVLKTRVPFGLTTEK